MLYGVPLSSRSNRVQLSQYDLSAGAVNSHISTLGLGGAGGVQVEIYADRSYLVNVTVLDGFEVS